ncbi:MAG: hypothetical protein Q9228_005859, partial [Teloschistes exilis]
MKIDCALLLLAALDTVHGHVVNQTGPHVIAKAPLPSGSGSPVKARNEPLYPVNNSTAPPCPTGTTSPLRWIRRHLPSASFTPEYRQASNPTAPPTATGTGSYGNPFRFIRSLAKRNSKERRNGPYYAASNSSTPCPSGTSTPGHYPKRAFVPLHPRHYMTVPEEPTGSEHRAVRRSEAPYSFQNSTLPLNQISDGQIQATATTVIPISQKSDGQIEEPTSSPSSAILVPTGIRPSSHSYSIPISTGSPEHQTYPPYPIVNSTSVHPHGSGPMPTGGFTSYHTPKAPGSAITYSNGTHPATSPEATSTVAHISGGGPSKHSTPPLTTGGHGAVRMSQSIASPAMASIVSQISDGQIQVPATVGSATIEVPYSTGSTILVVPTPVASSISSIASASGYSVAHSIASTAMASLVSQISDGQVQAPAIIGSVTITLPSYTAKATSIIAPASVATSISSVASVSGYSVAQSIASTAMASLISQIADGQVQAPVTKGSPISQITDGQIQVGGTTHVATSTKAPSTAEVHSGSIVTQITDGQIQAPGTTLVGTPLKASSTSVAHGVTETTDGQIQVPTTKLPASPVTQISDGQVQAPKSKTTAALVSQKSDGQVQASTSKASVTPVSQISDGQVQAPPTTKTIAATTTATP